MTAAPKPYRNQIIQGDALEVLRSLPDGIVQTTITSPPYWGLRDYGTADWEGGDPECDHIEKNARNDADNDFRPGRAEPLKLQFKDQCAKCGARRIDKQLGLEATPEVHVAKMVEIFREVRRVTRDDGTLWLNYGDSYANNACGGGSVFDNGRTDGRKSYETDKARGREATKNYRTPPGLKPKDLVGMPWRVAFALQADGWYLRSDIIWHKPNPMPESVQGSRWERHRVKVDNEWIDCPGCDKCRDNDGLVLHWSAGRPTKSHEYVFLLSKSARYFWDAEAVKEKAEYGFSPTTKGRFAESVGGKHGSHTVERGNGEGGRNIRDVWTIPTAPYSEAHFATFPVKLVVPCVLAGSPPKCCGVCGTPWVRVLSDVPIHGPAGVDYKDEGASRGKRSFKGGSDHAAWKAEHPTKTLGWRSGCEHDDDSGRSIVLDPFMGSGTVAYVAENHNRDYLGIELNPEYIAMAKRRLRQGVLAL